VERFWTEKPAELERDIERLDDFLWHSLCLAHQDPRSEK
jgi:hypothetical protein